MKDLRDKDLLEIIDMSKVNFEKYTKQELINLILFQADVMHEQEMEIGKLKYGIE